MALGGEPRGVFSSHHEKLQLIDGECSNHGVAFVGVRAHYTCDCSSYALHNACFHARSVSMCVFTCSQGFDIANARWNTSEHKLEVGNFRLEAVRISPILGANAGTSPRIIGCNGNHFDCIVRELFVIFRSFSFQQALHPFSCFLLPPFSPFLLHIV